MDTETYAFEVVPQRGFNLTATEEQIQQRPTLYYDVRINAFIHLAFS